MNKLSPPHVGSGPAQIGPAVLGASSFACADVLIKVVLIDGADALTISVVRAVLGAAMLFSWLKLVPPRGAFTARATWISRCSRRSDGRGDRGKLMSFRKRRAFQPQVGCSRTSVHHPVFNRANYRKSIISLTQSPR